MTIVIANIIAGLLAGIIFVVFYMLLHVHIAIAIVMALASFVGAGLLLAGPQKEIYIQSTHLTEREMKVMLTDARKKLRHIEQLGQQVSKTGVREKIADIHQVGEDIIDDFINDPKDVKAGRKFLNYYLESTEKIIKLYADLSRKTVYSDEELATLQRVETILDQIENAFHNQLSKLQQDDYLDLDSELAVLEMTMKSEGIR